MPKVTFLSQQPENVYSLIKQGIARLTDWGTREELATQEEKQSSAQRFLTLVRSPSCKDGMVREQSSLACATSDVSSVRTGTSANRRMGGN